MGGEEGDRGGHRKYPRGCCWRIAVEPADTLPWRDGPMGSNGLVSLMLTLRSIEQFKMLLPDKKLLVTSPPKLYIFSVCDRPSVYATLNPKRTTH